jgi:hypothetical protein
MIPTLSSWLQGPGGREITMNVVRRHEKDEFEMCANEYVKDPDRGTRMCSSSRFTGETLEAMFSEFETAIKKGKV